MLGKQASKSGQLNFEVKVVWIHSSHIITLFLFCLVIILTLPDLMFTKTINETESFLNNLS